MPAQASTGGIADAQFLDRGGIVQSAVFQILQRLGVAIELLLIKSGGCVKHGGRIGWRSTVLLEVSEALAEGQLAGQLDKAQEIAALAATVAVEEIFAGVDIERRAGFRVQGTESDELGAVASRPGNPVLLPQIIEQRQALLEFFEVLAHGAVASGCERRRRWPAFPGKDGGRRNFLSNAGAREPAEPESAKPKAQLADRPNHQVPTSERSEEHTLDLRYRPKPVSGLWFEKKNNS